MRSPMRSRHSAGVMGTRGTCNGGQVELHRASPSGSAGPRHPGISTGPCTAVASRKTGPLSADAAFNSAGAIAKGGDAAACVMPGSIPPRRSKGFTKPAFWCRSASAPWASTHTGRINRTGMRGGSIGNANGDKHTFSIRPGTTLTRRDTWEKVPPASSEEQMCTLGGKVGCGCAQSQVAVKRGVHATCDAAIWPATKFAGSGIASMWASGPESGAGTGSAAAGDSRVYRGLVLIR